MNSWVNLLMSQLHGTVAPGWQVFVAICIAAFIIAAIAFMFAALFRAKRLRIGRWFDFTASDNTPKAPPRAAPGKLQ